MEPWKKTSIKVFSGNIWYFKLYDFVRKTEDSGNFRAHRSALHKQWWAFRDSHCFQRAKVRKQYSEDNIHRITESYRELHSENTIQRITFRVKFREQHSE